MFKVIYKINAWDLYTRVETIKYSLGINLFFKNLFFKPTAAEVKSCVKCKY